MTDRITVEDLDDDDNDLVNHLLAELEAKLPRNLMRSAYYDGKRAVKQIGSVIPPQYYRLGLVLGWSAKAVDVLARRCNLDGFAWPDGDMDSLGAAEVWDGNMLGSEVNQGLISSLTHSTGFVVTTRGDESAGEPKALIHFKDALSATGDWNPRRRRLDNLLSITGRDTKGKPTSFALYLDGRTITAEVADNGAWVQTDETTHKLGVPAEPLVYKPRLGRPFGSSRISRPIIALQDMALREVIRLEGHMDVFSYPELWMIGATPEIFKDEAGNPLSKWQVMLGRIKGIPDDDEAASDTLARADVKQFPASDPTPHLAALNAIAKMFAREGSLPDTSLAITDVSNPTSAESYDASQHELINEAEGATDDWSPALRRSYVRALAIANDLDEVPASWSSITTSWRDVRYESRAAQADAGAKQLAALPWLAQTEVGLDLIGLTGQQKALALAAQRRQQGSQVLEALRAAAAARTGSAAPGPAQQ